MKLLGHIRTGQPLFLPFSFFKASLIVGGCRVQRVLAAFPAWKGDRCMKDTNHLGRDDSRHPERDAKLFRAWRLHMVPNSVWTRAKHPVGLERPHFWTRFRAQSKSWVAPAQQENSFGAPGENLVEAAEEGRNYLLQLRLQHLLQLVMRISLRKARK